MPNPIPVVFAVSCLFSGTIAFFYKWKYKYIPTENRRRIHFDEWAPCYDRTANRLEWVYGITRWRKRLIPKAKGHVLEIGAGTCRNIKYYNKDLVQSVTLVDFSRPMIREGKRKMGKFAMGGAQPEPSFPSRFFCYNVMQLPFPDESFDTLVDTFGLCSYELPVQSLQEPLRCLKVGGRLLLIEHGISTWPFVRFMQESFVERYASVWGCFNTRNIIAILKCCDCLEIKDIRRKNLGRYLIIECEKTAPKSNSRITDGQTITVDVNTVDVNDVPGNKQTPSAERPLDISKCHNVPLEDQRTAQTSTTASVCT